MEREQLVAMATDLAWLLWKGVPSDYKRRQALKVWDQFQSRLQGEAMATSNLGTFINSVCSKLNVVTLGRKADLEALDAILNSGQDRALLRLMREETALIVVKVRLLNEERKGELVDEIAEEEALIAAQQQQGEGELFDGLPD
jgi:hypothetical protein